MAFQAPFHKQRIFLVSQWHLIDTTVARRAADALGDVDTVIEIDETGQVVDALPRDRFVAAITISHRGEHRAAGPDLLVAIHARFRRRDAGEGGRLDGSMTITAIDTQLPDMVGVAERNRL